MCRAVRKREKIIIYGKGDFAKLIAHYFKNDSEYEVVAFCADKEFIDADMFCGLPLLPVDGINRIFPPDSYKAFVAVGYRKMRRRMEMFEVIKKQGYECVNYISSKAIIDKSVSIGENNAILAGTIIEPFVMIGNNNIIWTGATICHDTRIGSHCFVASQTVIGGFSIVEDGCFLGFNSTVIQGIHIKKETFITAKSLITRDTKPFTKYRGIPGKAVSTHEETGIVVE